MLEVEGHFIFHGHVQGVGFRFLTKQIADSLFLRGTVENLSDGTVEAFVQGDRSNIEKLLQGISKNRPGALEKVEVKYNSPTKKFSQFKILR